MLIAPDAQAAGYARDHGTQQDAAALKLRIEFSREALKRDPASPLRWCDLGFALLDSGAKGQAGTCFEQALKFGPSAVTSLSYAAQFYRRIHEPRNALRCTARILALTQSSKDEILAAYAYGGDDLMDTLNYGLPRDASVARAYFQYLLRTGKQETVRQAWDWMSGRSYPDNELANQYTDFLVQNLDYDRAVSVRLSSLGGKRGDYLISNFLYNGGFESEPSGSIFDWRISRTAGVDAAFGSGIAHSGRRSLRIDFGGEANVNYRHARQDVILKPGNYRFTAWVRTEDLTTDKGIAFRISDADSSVWLDVRTGQLTGTHDWTSLSTDMTVPKQTGRIRIEIIRDPSEKFDNKIRGTAWVDDVRLTLNVKR
jgi:hypothetical protein